MFKLNKIVPITISTLLVIMSILTVEVYALEVAPDFTITDIDGKEFTLSNYRGKVVVLDFFAIECPGCVDEIPHLKALQGEFGEDLVIIAIDTNARQR